MVGPNGNAHDAGEYPQGQAMSTHKKGIMHEAVLYKCQYELPEVVTIIRTCKLAPES